MRVALDEQIFAIQPYGGISRMFAEIAQQFASGAIPDVDLLEVIYGRTTACMDSDDAECAIITFLTGVIQGGASSPRISSSSSTRCWST